MKAEFLCGDVQSLQMPVHTQNSCPCVEGGEGGVETLRQFAGDLIQSPRVGLDGMQPFFRDLKCEGGHNLILHF